MMGMGMISGGVSGLGKRCRPNGGGVMMMTMILLL